MDIYVLDKSFETVDIIDSYESFIWTDRFQEAGDFELVLPVGKSKYLLKDYYLMVKGTEHMMIIEGLETSASSEEGFYVTVTGRSLESILDRRIVWEQSNLDGDLQNQICNKIIGPNCTGVDIDGNAISGFDSARLMNLNFVKSTDTRITSLTINSQYTGDNVYDVIYDICTEKHIGWKIIFNKTTKQFDFSLFSGEDRSYDNTQGNKFVVFSPAYDNLKNSNYIESDKAIKNVTLIAGEGEGTERKTATYTVNNSDGTAPTGLSRKEYYTDARDISTKTDDDTEMTDAEYQEKLVQRGKEKIADMVAVKTFECELDPKRQFVFNVDFFLGDICEVINEYDVKDQVRITEMVMSSDTGGELCYPSFVVVSTEEKEAMNMV